MNPLVSEVQRVSERMDSMISEVGRGEEALSRAKTLQVLEDVVNQPRDISYIIKLSQSAREIEKLFQLHQLVVKTMTESNGIVQGLLQEAMLWDDQFYSGLRGVSAGIDNMMTEVARGHEALNWTKVLPLLGEVVKHPRDISYVSKLAQMAGDVRGIYQLHQNVLNRATESSALLHRLLSEVE